MSAGSVSFAHTFHLSKFILDVAFMKKKELLAMNHVNSSKCSLTTYIFPC